MWIKLKVLFSATDWANWAVSHQQLTNTWQSEYVKVEFVREEVQTSVCPSVVGGTGCSWHHSAWRCVSTNSDISLLITLLLNSKITHFINFAFCFIFVVSSSFRIHSQSVIIFPAFLTRFHSSNLHFPFHPLFSPLFSHFSFLLCFCIIVFMHLYTFHTFFHRSALTFLLFALFCFHFCFL